MQMEHCVIPLNQLLRWLLRLIGATLLIIAASAAQASDAVIESAQLQLKPHRCVALHQGQMCYQTVQLSWSANQENDYCLYQQLNEAPLYCWQNTTAGQYRYEFASDNSVQLQLINIQTSAVVATATVAVAWVYKANTRRKTHWRLF
jgi:hypothetical protein